MRGTTIAGLCAALALGGCAGSLLNPGPPTGPGVVAVPSAGKALPVFQQDDAACREYASQQIAVAAPANNGYVRGTTPQQRYDIAYTQCMYSRGNTVLISTLFRGVPADYVYLDDPWFYGPWAGPSTFLGFGGFCCTVPSYRRGWLGRNPGWAVAHPSGLGRVPGGAGLAGGGGQSGHGGGGVHAGGQV